MAAIVKLLGLDFGTTTSSAVIASAQLARNTVSGRTSLSGMRELYRSEMIFTPYKDDRLDLDTVGQRLEEWLFAGDVCAEDIFGGGALLTGLSAQKENASGLIALIRHRLGDMLIATADDPCLESWLAFQGSCAALSHECPEKAILNLDIGGGTTNLALGRGGEVLRMGCLFVGARHFQVVPGTYRIVNLSRYARALLLYLGIPKDAGDVLTAADVDAVMGFYLEVLEKALAGEPMTTAIGRLHEQVPFQFPLGLDEVAVVVSGGAGELIYSHLDDQPWPGTTHFGDLGIDLARRLVESPYWGERLKRHRPASAGRATVYGLLRHNTEISGSTLFLPDPALLPLKDLPILGTVAADLPDDQLETLLTLAGRCPRGAALRVVLGGADGQGVRGLGRRLAAILRRDGQLNRPPLVLFVRENVGKTLGHYVTDWGRLPARLVVIDEVPVRDARFIHIGRMREQVVPVSYYGSW